MTEIFNIKKLVIITSKVYCFIKNENTIIKCSNKVDLFGIFKV